MSAAGPSRPRTDVLIRPAKPSDLPACAECWGLRRDTYPSIYPKRLSKDIPHAVRMQRNVDELAQELADTSRKVFYVATAPDDSDHVVGFVIWQKPVSTPFSESDPVAQTADPVADAGSEPDQDPDPERDHELAAKLQAESTEVKARFAEGKRMWCGHPLNPQTGPSTLRHRFLLMHWPATGMAGSCPCCSSTPHTSGRASGLPCSSTGST